MLCSPAKSTKIGKYAYINVNDSIEALNVLSNGGMHSSYHEHLAQNILNNLSIYNPVALKSTSLMTMANLKAQKSPSFSNPSSRMSRSRPKACMMKSFPLL